jgi:hypothetical protein
MTPWYERCYRWAQTNIADKDAERYDIPWWREQWKRTAVQAVIVNCAGARITFYPSKFPLQRRNLFLPDRDLFGELATAAREDGIAVVARMDSGGVTEEFRKAHPDWLTRTRDGNYGNSPCINSPYREEYVTGIFNEAIQRYQPDGFADNGGLGGSVLCFCDRCARRFRDDRGKTLPPKVDFSDPLYREWLRWSQTRILEVWDLNNQVTKAGGGPDCLYLGMVRKFQDNAREIARRTPLLLMDSQSRNDEGSFRENADEARYLHSLVGWNNVVTEAMSMTHHSHGYFRVASDPPAEARMYLLSGIAGGWQPWYHHIAAYSEDRRQYEIAPPVFQWHKKNEQYLVNRTPVATAGVLRSDLSSVFYARGAAPQLIQTPYRGIVHALFRSRFPYLPIHIGDMEREGKNLSVLILPNLGAMTDAECDFIRGFVKQGGALFATGMTSLYDSDGEPRKDFGLASVFGVHIEGPLPDRMSFAAPSKETYLRIPKGRRHEALVGFEGTDILPFGGLLTGLRVDSGRDILLRDEQTGMPALITGSYGKGRFVFLPADLDRRYGMDPQPDHARLLGNLFRWAAGDRIPFSVEGPGYIGSYLYRQPNRLILHLTNGTGTDSGDEIMDQNFPVGPLKIKVKLPADVRGGHLNFLVAERSLTLALRTGSIVEFEIPRLIDHEVVVIE